MPSWLRPLSLGGRRQMATCCPINPTKNRQLQKCVCSWSSLWLTSVISRYCFAHGKFVVLRRYAKVSKLLNRQGHSLYVNSNVGKEEWKKKKKVNSRCNKQVEWATGKKQKQRHKKIEGEETLFVRFLQPLKRTQSRLSLLLLRTCTESCSISFNYHHGDDRISYAKQVHTKSWFVFQLILAKNISNPWKPIWQSNNPYLFQTVFNWKL